MYFEHGGPIATEEQYENFQCSFAYLHSDGNISRFGETIGTEADIELMPIAVDMEPKVGLLKVFEAMANLEQWAKKGGKR